MMYNYKYFLLFHNNKVLLIEDDDLVTLKDKNTVSLAEHSKHTINSGV